MWVRRERGGWWILVAAAIMLAGVAVWQLRPSSDESTVAAPRLPPLSRRVTVEVLNGGGVTGAARLGTLALRQAGLDVVYYGTADSLRRGKARTVILVRRGDTAGVARARDMLGQADVVIAPDPTRLVDLSVILGRDFRAGPSVRSVSPD